MVFVRTLGAASIDAGAAHLTPSSIAQVLALLLSLGGTRTQRHARDAARHDLPRSAAPKAQHSIRELVYQLRKLGARIASDDETVEFAPESVPRGLIPTCCARNVRAIEHLRAAEGGFMPGYSPSHSEAFTEWLEGFRGRATAELNRVFVAELNRARRLGDWTLAEAAARAVSGARPTP